MKKTAIIALLAFFCIHASAQIPSYMPTTGLLAWYPFSGNANDSSGSMNHGMAYGGVTYTADRFGVANHCYHADSVSAVDFAVNNFPIGNAERSVSVFFKLDSPYAKGLRELFAWGSNSFVGSRFGLEVANDTAIGWESTGGQALTPFKADTMWHNLVVTYPAGGTGTSSIKLYVDGKFSPVTSIIAPVSVLNTPSGPIHTAGSLFLSYLYGFLGSIDDIAVWDHELTSCEIEKVFYGPTSLKPVISATGTLLSTGTMYTSYQWIMNGTTITGATSNTYTMTHGGIYKVAVKTPGGCPDTSVFYTTTLQAPGFAKADAVSIYPNPSKSIFNITANAPVKVMLTGMEGKIITKKERATQIDLATYPNGIYLLSVYDENGTWLKTERLLWQGN